MISGRRGCREDGSKHETPVASLILAAKFSEIGIGFLSWRVKYAGSETLFVEFKPDIEGNLERKNNIY